MRLLAPALTLAAPLLCLLWTFWPTLADLAQTWNTNPQYNHGFLVPVFAAILLFANPATGQLLPSQPFLRSPGSVIVPSFQAGIRALPGGYSDSIGFQTVSTRSWKRSPINRSVTVPRSSGWCRMKLPKLNPS